MEETIVYNPKYFKNINDEYSPSVPVNDFRWMGEKWNLDVNQMRKFPKMVADELLKRYGFLRKVEVNQVKNVLEDMKDKQYKCKYCEYESDSSKQLNGHVLGKHKMSKKDEELMKDIPNAKGVKVGKQENKQQSKTIEEQEGITGEGWYGAGLEEDKDFMARKKPGDQGTFEAG